MRSRVLIIGMFFLAGAGCTSTSPATPEAGDQERAAAVSRVIDQQVCRTDYDENGVELPFTTRSCTVEPPVREAPGLWMVQINQEPPVCLLVDLDRFADRQDGSWTGVQETVCP